MSMITYQDFVEQTNIQDAVWNAITNWKSGDIYKTAITADLYDRQQNQTIMEYVQKVYTLSGTPVENQVASNNRIASNFFRRLNTQRCTYSLGNGVTFNKQGVKDKFGARLDTVLIDAGYFALIHGVSFPFTSDRMYYFKATEFVPLFDEDSGAMRAGIRFWQLDKDKPMFAVLYMEDGYTKFSTKDTNNGMIMIEQRKPYIQHIIKSEADGEEVVGESNYSGLPVVPLWGSKLHQSTLVGMKGAIDSYDLIRSGFANDLTDCAQIYWILENYGGMTDDDLIKFRDRLVFNHIAEMDTSMGGKATPYTQEIPYSARTQYLELIKSGIYEDFGALDVHTIAAGATNDHIDAAYQPLDENADDFEAQIIECIQTLGKALGIDEEDAIPQFKRNRISNQLEQVQMLTQEAEWLDEQTILEKLPNVTVDEIDKILKRKDAEDMERMARNPFVNQEQAQEEPDQNEGVDDATNAG